MTRRLRELFGYSEQLESVPSLLFSEVKSVNLAFLVEIRYCFFIYAPAEVSGRVQFLDRAQDIVHQADEQSDRAGVHAEVFREGPEAAVYHVPGDVPRQVIGPVDHRDQGSDGDADQAEFQDEGDCGHEVKDGFDNRARLGDQEKKQTLSDVGANASLFCKKSTT